MPEVANAESEGMNIHNAPERTAEPDLVGVGSLLVDQSRARILVALIDGRAQTAKELAYRAGIAAPTATEHLAKLESAGLLGRERQGRNHYFRLANEQVASFLESALFLAADLPVKPLRCGPADGPLLLGPSCRKARCPSDGSPRCEWRNRSEQRKICYLFSPATAAANFWASQIAILSWQGMSRLERATPSHWRCSGPCVVRGVAGTTMAGARTE